MAKLRSQRDAKLVEEELWRKGEMEFLLGMGGLESTQNQDDNQPCCCYIMRRPPPQKRVVEWAAETLDSVLKMTEAKIQQAHFDSETYSLYVN